MALWALCLSAAPAVLAQSEDALQISLRRDFGYGGFGEIQGLFTISAKGPADLQRVTFLLDGESMGEITQAPFKLQFHTNSYAPGMHTLSAVGIAAGGVELGSNEIRTEFVTATEANQGMGRVLLPVVGLLVVVVIAVGLATLLTSRRHRNVPLGQPRHYGFSGGAICPKCSRPFPLSLLGFNLGFAKLTPCPHCGKWVRVRPRPIDELRAAEEAELARAEGRPSVAEMSEEEAQRKALEDSRYQDWPR
jgi:hypothetical protein